MGATTLSLFEKRIERSNSHKSFSLKGALDTPPLVKYNLSSIIKVPGAHLPSPGCDGI